jgi:uncharacterized protein YceH (UPF0502 family)
MKLIPVKDHGDLVRDVHSGAIININTSEVEKARERKAKRAQDRSSKQQLENRVDELSNDIEQIKQMLQTLLEQKV